MTCAYALCLPPKILEPLLFLSSTFMVTVVTSSPLKKRPPASLCYLKISIATQTLELFEQRDDEAATSLARYPISSSKFGLGTEPGTNKTPLGNFFIAEKIGDDQPEWMIFKSRKPTGEIATFGGDLDQVLTRILWLSGLDPDNQNTHDRYIYIHGTNQENLIGTPASHGCIRMLNADMVALFDQVAVEDHVEIVI